MVFFIHFTKLVIVDKKSNDFTQKAYPFRGKAKNKGVNK